MAEDAIATDDKSIETIDLLDIPHHVAIIMDGNGRWAAQRGLPRAAGHSSGVDAVRRTVRAAGEIGISYLTIYGFSSENWSRPQLEVNHLMTLLKKFIKRDLAVLHSNNVRVRVIGDKFRLDAEILTLIDEAQRLTADNTGLQLVAAFNYGARSEIVRAVRKIADLALDGSLKPEDITAKVFEQHLDTSGIPDPDLLIRTSGEERLSNFLLWQCAYTELIFTDVLWPDFGLDALMNALRIYQNRERRFGDVAGQPKS